MNPFTNCPPLPSPTQVQIINMVSAGGLGPSNGTLTLAVGGATLGPLSGQNIQFALQQALSLAFPGSVALGTSDGSGPQTQLIVQFFQDPGVAFTVVGNTLVDSNNEAVVVSFASNPGVLYPNYTYLTTRWTEFIIPGATPAQLAVVEQQLMALKQDAWRYVQPRNWGAFTAQNGGGAFVRATFLMIAHLKKLGKDPVGFITEQQAKNLRESYSDDKWMAGTVYGQEFMRLRNATILSMRFIPAGGGPRGWPSADNGFEGPSDTWYQAIN